MSFAKKERSMRISDRQQLESVGEFMTVRNEAEYKKTIALITEHHLRLVDRRENTWSLAGVPDEKVDEVLGDLHYNCRGLEDDIANYERHTARTWVSTN